MSRWKTPVISIQNEGPPRASTGQIAKVDGAAHKGAAKLCWETPPKSDCKQDSQEAPFSDKNVSLDAVAILSLNKEQ